MEECFVLLEAGMCFNACMTSFIFPSIAQDFFREVATYAVDIIAVQIDLPVLFHVQNKVTVTNITTIFFILLILHGNSIEAIDL